MPFSFFHRNHLIPLLTDLREAEQKLGKKLKKLPKEDFDDGMTLLTNALRHFTSAQQHFEQNKEELEHHDRALASRIENDLQFIDVHLRPIIVDLRRGHSGYHDAAAYTKRFAAENYGNGIRDLRTILQHLDELDQLLTAGVHEEEELEEELEHDELLEDKKKNIYEIKLFRSGIWYDEQKTYRPDRRVVRKMALKAIRDVIHSCQQTELDSNGPINLRHASCDPISDVYKVNRGNQRLIFTAVRAGQEVRIFFCQYFNETEHNYAVEHRHESHPYNDLLDRRRDLRDYEHSGFTKISSVRDLS